MKNMIVLIISFIFSITFLYPQQSDSLIQLYPGLGDTIDLFESEVFNFYTNIENFHDASFYIRGNEKFISKIRLNKNDLYTDTIRVHYLSILDKIRSSILKIDLENEKKSDLGTIADVKLEDNRSVIGELRMFSKSHLYMEIDNEQPQIDINPGALKIPLNKVDEIGISGQDKILTSAGWGVLTGLGLGGIIGMASGDDTEGFLQFTREEKALVWGIILGVIGGVIGLISGISSSTDDYTIEYNSTLDLLKLKDYAKYYFRELEKIEEKYKEFE